MGGPPGVDGSATGGAPGPGPTDGRSLIISGGTISINSGADALDANADVTVTGGTMVANSAVTTGGGDAAIDVDGVLAVSGGTIVANGLTQQTSAPVTDGQGTLTVTFAAPIAQGTRVTILDASGQLVASYVTPQEIATLVATSPHISTGGLYTVTTGGAISGGTTTGVATLSGSVAGGTDAAGVVTAS